MGSKAVFSNPEVAKHSDILVLSVKPQIVNKILPELRDSIGDKKTLLLSIAMGVSLKTLESVSK